MRKLLEQKRGSSRLMKVVKHRIQSQSQIHRLPLHNGSKHNYVIISSYLKSHSRSLINISLLVSVFDFCIVHSYSKMVWFNISNISRLLSKITYLFNFRGIMFVIRSSCSIQIQIQIVHLTKSLSICVSS
jgi:hypothetical protein